MRETKDPAAESARLLEDMAQTCAVLRASCLEQAALLRTMTGPRPDVARPAFPAEQSLYGQHPHFGQLEG